MEIIKFELYFSNYFKEVFSEKKILHPGLTHLYQILTLNRRL